MSLQKRWRQWAETWVIPLLSVVITCWSTVVTSFFERLLLKYKLTAIWVPCLIDMLVPTYYSTNRVGIGFSTMVLDHGGSGAPHTIAHPSITRSNFSPSLQNPIFIQAFIRTFSGLFRQNSRQACIYLDLELLYFSADNALTFLYLKTTH